MPHASKILIIIPLMTKSAEPCGLRYMTFHDTGETSTDSLVPKDKPGIALLVY